MNTQQQEGFGNLGENLELFSKYGLSFPRYFHVIKDKKESYLLFDKETRNIISLTEKIFVEDVEEIGRIKTRQVNFVLKNGRVEKYILDNNFEREKCIEYFWLLRDGLFRPLSSAKSVELFSKLKIICGTWNLGDAPPLWNTDPIHTWLGKGRDIYAVTAQECQYTSRSGYATCADDFFGWIGQHLGGEYVKLAGVSLRSIRLVVFIKQTHYYKISNLRYGTVATGIGNIIGNKGAASIAFNYYENSFCFVGTHLAARIDRTRLAARNQNYRDIISKLPFSINGDGHNEFDHMFWMGDLNYRLELDRDSVFHYIQKEDWPNLLRHDQLFHEKALQNCFYDFIEGPINFKPTYRYNRGSRTWSDEKMREPAYCDRILWKTFFKDRVKLLTYDAAHQLMTSDHSPVYAEFSVQTLYPALPHTRKKCIIRISNLCLHEHDTLLKKFVEQNQSLTLIFQATWLTFPVDFTSQISSGVIRWPDIELVPTVTMISHLQATYLRFVICENSGKSTLATGVLTMESILDKRNFVCNLSEKGIPFTKLNGTIQLIYLPVTQRNFRTDISIDDQILLKKLPMIQSAPDITDSVITPNHPQHSINEDITEGNDPPRRNLARSRTLPRPVPFQPPPQSYPPPPSNNIVIRTIPKPQKPHEFLSSSVPTMHTRPISPQIAKSRRLAYNRSITETVQTLSDEEHRFDRPISPQLGSARRQLNRSATENPETRGTSNDMVQTYIHIRQQRPRYLPTGQQQHIKSVNEEDSE